MTAELDTHGVPRAEYWLLLFPGLVWSWCVLALIGAFPWSTVPPAVLGCWLGMGLLLIMPKGALAGWQPFPGLPPNPPYISPDAVPELDTHHGPPSLGTRLGLALVKPVAWSVVGVAAVMFAPTAVLGYSLRKRLWPGRYR